MRQIIEHALDTVDNHIVLTVRDEPGAGGACHTYVADWNEPGKPFDAAKECIIDFQNGPIAERGVNGITQEVLLAIVADRLRGFQSGNFACAENEAALGHVERALASLKARTASRLARGAEGTNIP